MSSNDAEHPEIDADRVASGDGETEPDMTDPEEYGSLTIEDPDGDDEADADDPSST